MKKILLLLALMLGIVQETRSLQFMENGQQPILGHYLGNDGYNQMILVTSYPITQEQLNRVFPNSVAAINPNREKTFFVRVTVTTGMNSIRGAISPTPLPWNVMFHPWSRVPINTTENVDMGLFYPNGVAQAANPIAFNALQGTAVNPHDEHYSPNNARFQPEQNREFMTFSLAAQRQNRGIATYDILIHNEIAKNNIQIMNANTPGFTNPAALINYLDSGAFKNLFQNRQDVDAINQTIQNLRAIFGIQAGALQQPAQQNPLPAQWEDHNNAGMDEEAALAAAMQASLEGHPNNQQNNDIPQEILIASRQAEEQRRRQAAEARRQERNTREAQQRVEQVANMGPNQLRLLINSRGANEALREAARSRLAQLQQAERDSIAMIQNWDQEALEALLDDPRTSEAVLQAARDRLAQLQQPEPEPSTTPAGESTDAVTGECLLCAEDRLLWNPCIQNHTHDQWICSSCFDQSIESYPFLCSFCRTEWDATRLENAPEAFKQDININRNISNIDEKIRTTDENLPTVIQALGGDYADPNQRTQAEQEHNRIITLWNMLKATLKIRKYALRSTIPGEDTEENKTNALRETLRGENRDQNIINRLWPLAIQIAHAPLFIEFNDSVTALLSSGQDPNENLLTRYTNNPRLNERDNLLPTIPTPPAPAQPEEECLICQEAIPGDGRGGEEVLPFECTHSFHRECADNWIAQGNAWNSETRRYEPRKCPLCRANRNTTYVPEDVQRDDHQERFNQAVRDMENRIEMPYFIDPTNFTQEEQTQLQGIIRGNRRQRATESYIRYIENSRDIFSSITDLPLIEGSFGIRAQDLPAPSQQQINRALGNAPLNYYLNLLNPANGFPQAYNSIADVSPLANYPINNFTPEQRQQLQEALLAGHVKIARNHYFTDYRNMNAEDHFMTLLPAARENARQGLVQEMNSWDYFDRLRFRLRERANLHTPITSIESNSQDLYDAINRAIDNMQALPNADNIFAWVQTLGMNTTQADWDRLSPEQQQALTARWDAKNQELYVREEEIRRTAANTFRQVENHAMLAHGILTGTITTREELEADTRFQRLNPAEQNNLIYLLPQEPIPTVDQPTEADRATLIESLGNIEAGLFLPDDLRPDIHPRLHPEWDRLVVQLRQRLQAQATEHVGNIEGGLLLSYIEPEINANLYLRQIMIEALNRARIPHNFRP